MQAQYVPVNVLLLDQPVIKMEALGTGVGLKVPKTVNGIKDERVTLPATYDSTETVISITWSKVVGGMGGERKMVYIYSPNLEYSHGPLFRRAQLVGKASLEINETKLEDEGLYVITVVLNIVGQEEKYVRLNVMVRPTVLVGPEDPYIVRWDTSVSLTCTVVNAKPNITSLRWEKNGVSLTTPGKKYGGGTAMLPTLNIHDVSKMDAGTYTCVVDHVTDTEQLRRWAEHFSELLNRPAPDAPPDIPPAEADLPINCEKTTKAEIRQAIKSLKNWKAAGPDEVPAEAIKADTETAVSTLHSLFNKIWEEERVPAE
ncbi:hypothetical protein Bbelb_026310 [Branchiostoma belcheri]|nr:hypothetical protein Bbelb_026310 [Branchiostoma belcheri]